MMQTTDKIRMSLVVTYTTSPMLLQQLGMAFFSVFAFVSRILQASHPLIQSQPSIKVCYDLNLCLSCILCLHCAVEVRTSTLTHVESAETHKYLEGLSITNH